MVLFEPQKGVLSWREATPFFCCISTFSRFIVCDKIMIWKWKGHPTLYIIAKVIWKAWIAIDDHTSASTALSRWRRGGFHFDLVSKYDSYQWSCETQGRYEGLTVSDHAIKKLRYPIYTTITYPLSWIAMYGLNLASALCSFSKREDAHRSWCIWQPGRVRAKRHQGIIPTHHIA